MMDRSTNTAGAKQRVVWTIFVLAVACVNSATLTISPPIWQDEVQIVEFGRTTLCPATDWSINTTADGKPAFILSYLGPVLQEVSYSLTSSLVGPRLSALLGAIVAASLCRLWLQRRGIPTVNANLLAGILLLEPTFVQGYKGARVDSWALAFIFAALLALQIAFSKKSLKQSLSWCVAGGAFTALATFTWISAVLLWPLVVAELLVSKLPRKFMAFAAGVAGMIVASALLCFPIWDQLFAAVSLVFTHTRSDSLAHSLRLQLPELLDTIKLSPFFFIAAVCATVMSRRNWLMGGLFVLTLVLVLVTRMYVHRYVYLLPYMCVLTAALSEQLGSRSRFPVRIEWNPGRAALGMLLLWAGLVTLLARPYFALKEASGRSPELLETFVAEYMVPGESVYLSAWELYYACRKNGSKLFRAYDYSLLHDPDILKEVDCVVSKWPVDEGLLKMANEMGFRASEYSDGTEPYQMRRLGASPYVRSYVLMRR